MAQSYCLIASLSSGPYSLLLHRRACAVLQLEYQPKDLNLLPISIARPEWRPSVPHVRAECHGSHLFRNASATESLVQQFQNLKIVDTTSEIRAELGVELEKSYVEYRHTEFAQRTHHSESSATGRLDHDNKTERQSSRYVRLESKCVGYAMDSVSSEHPRVDKNIRPTRELANRQENAAHRSDQSRKLGANSDAD